MTAGFSRGGVGAVAGWLGVRGRKSHGPPAASQGAVCLDVVSF